jgi:SnoaL-like domain
MSGFDRTPISYPSRSTRNTRVDTRSQVADTHWIDETPAAPEVTSERLARRWFALIHDGSFERLREMLHEDVVIVSKVRPGEIVEGRQAVASFIESIVSHSLYDAVTEDYTPLDDERVIVEGRMRWIDDERVIRDDPAVWAMEFRDGLVLRFLPARSALEAETLLAAAPSDSP